MHLNHMASGGQLNSHKRVKQLFGSFFLAVHSYAPSLVIGDRQKQRSSRLRLHASLESAVLPDSQFKGTLGQLSVDMLQGSLIVAVQADSQILTSLLILEGQRLAFIYKSHFNQIASVYIVKVLFFLSFFQRHLFHLSVGDVSIVLSRLLRCID